MTTQTRRTMLITGANGGMGKNIARRLGSTANLILTDIALGPLDAFAATLTDEGYTVLETTAGDLADDQVLSKLVDASKQHGGLDAVVHTAGLSPTQADWQKILHVNIVATQRLLAAIAPCVNAGGAAVLIASMAGYVDPSMPDADNILDGTLVDTTLDQVKPFLYPSGTDNAQAEAIASQLAYVLSKRGVIRLVERSAAEWGARQTRIVSISPGLIYTPMGIKESESDERTKSTIAAQPINRWGTASDIAGAVEFLLSDGASFITGCDLRVDGGASLLSKTA